VLQGPTVQLRIGLICTRENADLRADDTSSYYRFMRSGSATPVGNSGWGL